MEEIATWMARERGSFGEVMDLAQDQWVAKEVQVVEVVDQGGEWGEEKAPFSLFPF